MLSYKEYPGGRDTSSASPAELWEHDHTNCKLWRWIQPDSSPGGYEQRQFLEQFGVPRDVYFHYYDILKEELPKIASIIGSWAPIIGVPKNHLRFPDPLSGKDAT